MNKKNDLPFPIGRLIMTAKYFLNKTIMARKPNAMFMKPWKLDDKLSAVVGSGPLSRPQIVKKLWAYIKRNGLQDKKEKTMIKADAKMQTLFGKPHFSMFEMNKWLGKHLS